MKYVIHKGSDRGYANHGWLESRHSFSFGEYYDPYKMGFGVLRVINDDKIAGGQGFGMHPHNNMEIITIPTKGTVKHKDSIGNEGEIHVGEVQVMSAGTGVAHSEFNGSPSEMLELFQIWIEPEKRNVKPRYDQKKFSDIWNELQLLVSSDGRDESLIIHQNAFISVWKGDAESFEYELYDKRNGVYLLVIDGEIIVENTLLGARDAIEISEQEKFKINIVNKAEILILEVPLE